MISSFKSTMSKFNLHSKIVFSMILMVFFYQMYQSLRRGWTIDFKTFYLAAYNLLHHIDIYSIEWASDHGPFLNGPMYALFLAPFGLLPPPIALASFQICNTLILLGCAYQLSNKFSFERYRVMGTIISFMVIFNPIRVNFQFGQVMTVVLGAFTVFCFFYERRMGKWDDFLAALAIGAIFHIKPYIALPVLILILFQKRWTLMIWGLIQQVLIFLALSVWLSENLLTRWVQELVTRQESSVTTHNDQGSLLSLLVNVPHLPSLVSYLIVSTISIFVFSVFLICLLNQHVPTEQKVIFAAVSGTMMSTYLHNYDYALLLFPILLLVISSNTNFMVKAIMVGLSASVPVIGIPLTTVMITQLMTISVFWFHHWYYHRNTERTILSFAACYFISTVSIAVFTVFGGDSLWLIKFQLWILNLFVFIALILKFKILKRIRGTAYQGIAA